VIRNPKILKYIYNIKPSAIIHIGGHLGQDGNTYDELAKVEVFWGEGIKENAEEIKRRHPNHKVISKMFWSTISGFLPFYKLEDNRSSSLMKPLNNNIKILEEITNVETTTLDFEFLDIDLGKNIFMVLDVQGAELEVLNGGQGLLKRVKYLVIEVSQDIENEYSVQDNYNFKVFEFMQEIGFKKSICRPSHDLSYVDQLYLKSNNFNLYLINLLDNIISIISKVFHFISKKHLKTSSWNCEVCNLVQFNHG